MAANEARDAQHICNVNPSKSQSCSQHLDISNVSNYLFYKLSKSGVPFEGYLLERQTYRIYRLAHSTALK